MLFLAQANPADFDKYGPTYYLLASVVLSMLSGLCFLIRHLSKEGTANRVERKEHSAMFVAALHQNATTHERTLDKIAAKLDSIHDAVGEFRSIVTNCDVHQTRRRGNQDADIGTKRISERGET